MAISDLEGKRLLIIGATISECDIVRNAKAMGVYTIVADYKEDSPAKKVADKAVLTDALDVDALVELARKEKVDGVITGFVDILLRPYLEVCKRLDMPCYVTEKLLSMSTNKVVFKETCMKYGIPVPKTYFLSDHLGNTAKDLPYPVFVKPLDGSGSRGAGVCRNKAELEFQFAEALSYSAGGKAVIEEYLTGREFLLDYVAAGGEFRLLSIFDRFMADDRASAVNYSTISMSPSKAVDYYLEHINDKVINMFKSEGITDGVLFMQGYHDGDSVKFYEMGCRLGGSYYNHEQACLGCNAMDMLIRYALTGKMVEDINAVRVDSAKYGKYALDCNYLLKGSDETVAEIVGLNEIAALPECIEIQRFHDVGFHYGKDRMVDKAIIVVEIVADTKENVIKLVNFINGAFDVFNKSGQSLLMKKLDPAELFA